MTDALGALRLERDSWRKEAERLTAERDAAQSALTAALTENEALRKLVPQPIDDRFEVW